MDGRIDSTTIFASKNDIVNGILIFKLFYQNEKIEDVRCVEVNKPLEQIYSIDRNDLLGRTLENILSDLGIAYAEVECAISSGINETTMELFSDVWNHPVTLQLIRMIDNLLVVQFLDLLEIKDAVKYKPIFDNFIDVVLLLKENGEIIDCNDMAVKEYGYSKEQLIGRRIFNIKSKENGDMIDGRLHEPDTDVIVFETYHYRKDRTKFAAEVRLFRIETDEVKLLLSVIRNVSNMKLNMDKLKQMAAVAQSSEDAIILRRYDGIITSWNEGAEKLLGYTANEIIGKNIASVMYEGTYNKVMQISQKILHDGRLDPYEGVFLDKNNNIVIGQVNTFLIKHEDNTGTGISIVIKNLTNMTLEKYKLLMDLRNAIAKDQLMLHYQPQLDVFRNEVIGVEALLRWKTESGYIPPNVFIPIAEEANLIVAIGEWVLKEACSMGHRLFKRGHRIMIAVNISRLQFKTDYLIQTVSKILEKTMFPPELLELEITESILMDNEEECEILLRELKRLGVKVSIDDFGTGYSSLAYLKKFIVDKIKIDRSFIQDIPSKDNGMIANVIIQLSKNLGFHVIAEGAETKEQIDFLKENDCSEVQGYFYSKPLTEEELYEYLQYLNDDRLMRYIDTLSE